LRFIFSAKFRILEQAQNCLKTERRQMCLRRKQGGKLRLAPDIMAEIP
jgi:hypothetical protein